MGNTNQHVEKLEEIIRALADVWPADRENVAVAGARLEEFIEGFDENAGQLQKLIDLAWEGLKYLFEEDEYFMSVKPATMQAVNTIREYLLKDGDIQVEDFEKACDDLETALSGGGESADTLIELDEINDEEKSGAEKSKKEEGAHTLDDLATLILGLSLEDITEEELKKLYGMLQSLAESEEQPVAEPLQEAIQAIERAGLGEDSSGKWFDIVSEKTEEAIEIKTDEAWSESADQEQAAVQEEGLSEKGGEAETEEFYIPEDIDPAMVGEFITECTELLEMAEGALLDLEERPDDEELVNKVFRAFHTIKGTSAFMGLDPISEFTHLLETVLSMIREGELEFDTACADISLEAIDIINQMLDVVEVSDGGDLLPKPNNFELLIRVLEEVSEEGTAPEDALAAEGGISYGVGDTSEVPVEEMAENMNGESAKNGAADKSSDSSKSDSSVRVNVGRLDRLIDMIGELVIAHSVVAQDESIPDHSDLQKKISHTSKILRELQDTSLTLRMVPLKATFHKMNRLVRDLGRKAGKSVKLSTHGEDTEIDRNMVDIISEPLVHMIRNAIDHGIETPEEREEAGKPAKANIWLRASQEGGKVVIEIEDDGRGINKEKVLEKAIDKGLVEPGEKLTDSEIYNLIFLPGFSSTDEVTDLSGRGVGMDVVRRSIEELKGKVDVTSEPGEGTKITIELPFTLAITDGMLVNVGSQRFIVPTLNIDMAFRAEEKDVFTVLGNSEKVSIRGETMPVVRLHRHFNIEDGIDDLVDGTLLIIRNANKKYALLVDEVIGQQQLVGKSINMMTKMDHISGGAILGDGRVGLILDTAALMN
ncbi:chemotaxis protein CheA [Aliifodinibius sp. S!AR15-10]|uniref:chemotaxis protein CheA n=1 Tax=Aliifodinibius sp. S!AR15-10 TaxID=2950437 RepID=UPI00285D817A|nr:chemotaxis protein CheA [Aliifodinibius sp. S!AR15-10]MDR8392848.1 chemotaxis protein CheA [Aliifodinibius sp. S!AR15-10]